MTNEITLKNLIMHPLHSIPPELSEVREQYFSAEQPLDLHHAVRLFSTEHT